MKQRNCFIGSEVTENLQIGYNQRYLDALASIFFVQSVCAAVIQENTERGLGFRLSYNKPDKPNSKAPIVFKEIENVINQILNSYKKPSSNNNLIEKLLYVHLITSLGLKGGLNNILKLHNLQEIQLLHKITMDAGASFSKALLDNKEAQYKKQQAVLDQYFDVLNKCKTIIHDDLYSKILLRPLQDVTKLLSYLHHQKVCSIWINVVPFEENLPLNTEHAEINLAFYAQRHINGKQYIGISKLSCLPCDVTLGILGGYPHRGTHGLCFTGWNKQLDFKQEAIQENDEVDAEGLRKEQERLEIDSENCRKDNKQYKEEGDFTDEVLMRQYRTLSTDQGFEDWSTLQKHKQTGHPASGASENGDLSEGSNHGQNAFSSSTSTTTTTTTSSSSDGILPNGVQNADGNDVHNAPRTPLPSENAPPSDSASLLPEQNEEIPIRNQYELLGKGDEGDEGEALFDHTESSPWHQYWYKYTKTAMNELLKLRFDSTKIDKALQIINPNYKFDGTTQSAKLIAQQIAAEISEGTSLVILNLYGKHWVGLAVDKAADKIKVTYMDSEQTAIPELLKEQLMLSLAASNPESAVTIIDADLEVQKYNNCGPEVIENFVSHVTGHRASQDDAIELHSELFENAVTLSGTTNCQYS